MVIQLLLTSWFHLQKAFLRQQKQWLPNNCLTCLQYLILELSEYCINIFAKPTTTIIISWFHKNCPVYSISRVLNCELGNPGLMLGSAGQSCTVQLLWYVLKKPAVPCENEGIFVLVNCLTACPVRNFYGTEADLCSGNFNEALVWSGGLTTNSTTNNVFSLILIPNATILLW